MPEGNQGKEKDEIRLHPSLEVPLLEDRIQSPIVRFMSKFLQIWDAPVTWYKETIAERFRGEKYPYYHMKIKRVPTIDECFLDDFACIYEANTQYKRDKRVDEHIVGIARKRYYNCLNYERAINEFARHDVLCPKEWKAFKEAELNYFIKYGDLGPYGTVIDAYMKQKHRLIMERREAEKNGVDK